MAYGLKYTAGFCGDVHKFEVNIYQDGYTNPAIEGTLAGDFFNLQYTGDDSHILTPLKTSECTATLWVQKGSPTETFVSDLITFQEKKYILEIKRGPIGGALAVLWRGVVLQDNFSAANDCDYAFNITAVCGLARLKDETGTVPSSNTNIVARIINMLGGTVTGAMYSASDVYLITNVRFFENQHTATTKDPLSFTNYDNPGVHTDYNENGVNTQRSHYDVLASICRTFAAQLKFANGCWYFMQPTNQTADTITVTKYPINYNPGSNPSTPTVAAIADNVTETNAAAVNNTVALSTTNAVVVAGSSWLYQPALKRVELVYNFNGNRIIYQASQTNLQSLTATGYTVASGGGRINVQGNTTIIYTIAMGGGLVQCAFDWYVQIKCGANYWDGTQWQTTAANVWINTTFYMVNNGLTLNETEFINLTTGPLSAGGAVEIKVFAQPKPVTGITFTNVSQLTTANVLLLNTLADNSTQLFSATNTNANTNSSFVLDYGQTYIGDNPGAPYNKLMVHNTTAWVDAAQWNLNALTGGHTILKLATQYVLALQTTPLRIVDATIWGGDLEAHKHIKWVVDGVTYRAVFMAGEYNGANDNWRGTWAVISLNTGNTAPNDPIGTLKVFASNGNTAGTAPNQLLVGKLASTTGTLNGTITSITIAAPGHGNIKAGDIITVTNPATGLAFNATVSADVGASDTAISVGSVATGGPFAAGSIITQTPNALAAKTVAVAQNVPNQIAAWVPLVVEISANHTLTNSNNNQLLVLLAGCDTVTTDTLTNGFKCRAFNKSGASVEISGVAYGPTTVADGALVEFNYITGVGWIVTAL